MTKLNQGADAALVTAATRAGLASAPPDYSRTFEHVADGYRKTMEANSDMWGKITTVAANSFVAIKAAQKEKMEGPGGMENLANGQELIDKVKGFGKELWGTRKLEGGYFGDQAKEARVEINKRKDAIYAFAQSNAAGEQAFVGMFNERKDKKGNIIPPSINAEATGIYPMEVASAYAQSQIGGTTEKGNYFVPEEGKDGKMGWTMYHDPNKIKYESKAIKTNPFVTKPDNVLNLENDAKPTKPNGQPVLVDGKKIRYTMAEINGMMVQKDPNMKKLLNNVYDIALKSGANSGGNPEIGKYQQNEMDEGITEISRNRAAWYQKSKYGEGGKSFHGELTQGVSVASANLFGQLSNVVANGDKSLANTGILAGIDGMSDGTPGIQAADFQNEENYNALTMTLFNPGNKNYDPEVTAGIFKEHMQAKIRDVQAHGWSKSSKNPVNKPGYVPPGQGGKLLPPIDKIKSMDMFNGGNDTYVSEAVLTQNYQAGNAMVERASLGKGDDKYTWDDKKKTYFHSTLGVVANKASMFAFINRSRMEDNASIGNTFKSQPFYMQIPDWDGTAYVSKEEVKEKKRKKVFGIF
jgi:hypothetical protein|tara:strand:- start:21 stop:1763 length:1743 start_codon:yes stop_codon:yes gene_type:complete